MLFSRAHTLFTALLYRIFLVCLPLGLFSSAELAAAPRLPNVVADEALAKPITRELKLTGTVTSAQVAQLSVATSGLIQKIDVEAGDTITRGATLLHLDDEIIAHRVNAAEATRKQAELAAQDAQRRLREAQQLKSQRGIAETRVRDLEAEVEQDGAALAQAIAEAERERALLERHRLVAPFDGIISRRLVEVGEWIVPGDTAFELVSTSRLRLDFSASEDYLGDLKPGAGVKVYLNARPGKMIDAVIDSIVPVTDPGDRTFLVRVTTREPDPTIQPGMSATARFALATGRSGLVVSRDAVLRYPDGRSVVWTVHKEGEHWQAQENIVRTGLAAEGNIEIIDGLSPGDRVVVRGNDSLQNNQPVNVVDTGASPTE